jgi:hypothetical protein
MKKHRLTKFLIFIGISLSCLMISLQGYSQTGKVTGKVTDMADGLPLPGVTITVKGTTNAAGTNVDGLYSINAAPGSTLIFSFIGYDQKEIVVPSSGTLNVALSATINKLNEVVVIGYGTARRKDLVSSVDVVSAKDAGSNTATSAAQLLIGKAPGVQVTNQDGVPGSTPQITIRGIGSFTNANPL